MDHGRGSRTPQTEDWGEALFGPEPPALAAARRLAAEAELPTIAISPAEGRLLAFLLRLVDARRVVDIGTLFGYSALSMARALPVEGRVWTFEASSVHAQVAREAFRAAGMAERIILTEGSALDTLDSIVAKGPFDAVFIDADKVNYPNYLDWAERNVRRGGLIIGDNTYFFGQVHQAEAEVDEESRPGLAAMQAFNRRLADSRRYDGVLLSTGEGMTIGRKLF